EGFFDYVFRGPVVPDFETLKECITEFRIAAIRKFGNVKFAFKKLSQMTKEEIEGEIVPSNSEAVRNCYTNRHDPLISIKRIEPKDTYYLGYLVATELKKNRIQLEAAGASTAQVDEQERRRLELLETGEFNHHCYLDYDHMDVYVATSMREKSDFWNVSRFVSEVFGKPEVKELKLRYFDPTQAYCHHRIDKGLSEAL